MMMATWISQNAAKENQIAFGSEPQPVKAVLSSRLRASAPIQVWMPNQPQATAARSIAATLAPRTPNEARHSTGNEMPYRVPAWAFRIIGMRTMTLPSRMVSIACHQVIPCDISPEASV